MAWCVMIGSLAKKLFGSANDRYIKSLQSTVEKINALESQMERLSDDELRGRTQWFRERLAGGETLDDLLVDAFATVREAGKRALHMRHFDVQLIGGIILHNGMISEMRTGEGKTLVCTLAAYLNALPGDGVHVVTVNDYLAQRDSEWMGKLHTFLGLTVGCIHNDMDDEERKQAYSCDITYATNNELGFDYLRDNMKFSRDEMVLRPFTYAIVDEVDSILIDEARTPLIISGPTEDNSDLYTQVDDLVKDVADSDYEKDEKQRSVTLTENGVQNVEKMLMDAKLLPEDSSLYDIEYVSLVHHVNQALRAHTLFTRDVDYIVKDDKVIIIDEFTGRMMDGRRYSEGLHQALEAKERVKIQNENQTLASITFQNLFRMYPKLSGMTGTAMTEAGEFGDIYSLNVIEIPTNKPINRSDNQDEIYRTASEKYRAIIVQIADCLSKGQPILVGTASIEKSEYISGLLKDKKYLRETSLSLGKRADTLSEQANKASGKAKEEALEAVASYRKIVDFLDSAASRDAIAHHVLNARYHEREAFIIAQAGQPAAVTIATNMAGRGTDIMLGGNAEMLIAEKTANLNDAEKIAALTKEIEAEVAQAKQDVLSSGGLMVIGTERHESRRIDNQLRGRSGRQGDPGGSKFFLSLEDDLMRIFGSERIDSLLQKLGMKEDEAIFHPWMTRAIEHAQQKVEQRNYEIRKNLLKYDDVMNDQRKVIYEQRIELMEEEDISDTVDSMRDEINYEMVTGCIPPKSYPDHWQAEELQKELYRVYGLKLPVEAWAEEEGIADPEILSRVNELTKQHFMNKTERFGKPLMNMAEKRILMQTLDQLWKDHLLSLDHLRQGIHLRGYGQRDPLNEYKQEAFNLFEHMLSQLRELTVSRLSHLEIHVERPDELAPPPAPKTFEGREDPALAETEAQKPFSEQKVGRNEPCPCGSGKKFKHCHGSI